MEEYKEMTVEEFNKVKKIGVKGGFVGVFDIVLATDTDCDLTEKRPYVVRELNALDMFTVENDKGVIDIYSTDWFEKYDFETHGRIGW